MRKFSSMLLTLTIFTSLHAAEFTPFTGRVLREKVRIRIEPSLDAEVVKEVGKEDLVIVTGESDDFYEIKPPAGSKSYLFRTFVLDGAVEGAHVNVRLKPDTNAPVLTQLNTGDKVDGTILASHNKWLEIAMPESVRFYIAKDFIKNIGSETLLEELVARRESADQLMSAAEELAAVEMQKPFDAISLDAIYETLTTLQRDYADFDRITARATNLKQTLQEACLQKKIAHLEARAESRPHMMDLEEIALADTTPEMMTSALPQEEKTKPDASHLMAKLKTWLPRENSLYHEWLEQHEGAATLSDFYKEQKQSAVTLTGIIEPYTRPVRNKPGDYVLLSRLTRLPIAFIYSTVINLDTYKDREVTLEASSRPNNNFAFPAYFVHSVE